MIFQRGKRAHKYGAVRVTHHSGRSFASKLEAALYDQLYLLQEAREISMLRCQPHVFLTEANIEMIPDFCALDRRLVDSGIEPAVVYFEAKGFETPEWRLKRKLWTWYGPGRLRVYKGSAKSLRMVEEIVPRR